MTRFWTRFIHSFQKEKRKNKLPVIAFDEYTTSPNHLKESSLYGYYLVRIERLEYAYNMLLIHQNKKPYWKMMAPLLQIWYTELEKVNQQSQNALAVLQFRLDDLSQALETISSPHKNRDRRSLKMVQQFISTHLKEWDLISKSIAATTASSNNICNSRRTDNRDRASSVATPSNQHALFLETALRHKTIIELRDSQYQNYYEDIEKRIRLANDSNNMRLTQCIRQVHRLQQDLYLHHIYVTSQFSILWDLGSVCLSSSKDYEQEPKLYEATKMKWQQQYLHQSKAYQDLKIKFKEVLKLNTVHREDFTCAICLSILREPVTLTSCNHTFCKSCIQHMYCAHCYRHRAKTISRISENLSSLISKPRPVVHCTCHIIDRISGEPTLVRDQQEATCPLCRVAFDPDHCTQDLALEKLISMYFPKRNDDDDDDDMHDNEGDDKENAKNKRKEGRDQKGKQPSRRRSQVNASRFYSKMQRWSSHKQTNGSVNTTEDNLPPVPPIRESWRIRNEMFSIATRSWVF